MSPHASGPAPDLSPPTDDGIEAGDPAADSAGLARRVGFVLGPLLGLASYLALSWLPTAPEVPGAMLSDAGPATAAIAVWMAVWWLTEAIPIYATALLPLAAFPLTGVRSMHDAAAPYAHELIFLFMGGFMLALAMQRTGLHRRFALETLRLVGDRPTSMIGGFMAVAAMLSMWVSNTATAVMMLPVATSVLELAEERAPRSWTDETRRHFGLALLLGVAYGASIGGVATPIGTPPNLFLLSFLSSTSDVEISFARWMAVGLPLVLVMLPATWWLMVHRIFPIPAERLEGGRDVISRDLRALGAVSQAEAIVLAVFVTVCSLWLSKPLLATLVIAGATPFAGLDDASIAMAGAIVLFCAPAGDGSRVLDWQTARTLPWGILILFGGGLSLASAIGANGVDEWIGAQSGILVGLPAPLVVMGIVAGMVFLTELTSNTASAAALIPILAALAPGLGLSPIALAVPAALAASFAFMLPVATPPNAVVFGSGRIPLREMIRAGLWLNLIGIAVISALTFVVVLPILVD